MLNQSIDSSLSMSACSDVWQIYPRPNEEDAVQRWSHVCEHVFTPLSDQFMDKLSSSDIVLTKIAKNLAMDFNVKNDVEQFKKFIENYIAVFTKAIERGEPA